CGYKQTALKDYQAVIDPDKPLDQMTLPQRGSAWVKICERIEKAVSAPDPPPRPPVPLPPDPHPRPPKTLMIVGIIVLLIVASVFIWQRIKPSHHNPTPNPASPSPVILTPTQSPSPPPGDRIITAGAPVKGSIVTDQDRYFFKFQASSTKTRVI